MIFEPRNNRIIRGSAGFTLVELLVALGVLLLLTLGINEVFRSVTRVVSVGSGIAETNAAARIIERQLRDDFAALNRLPADQNFMVIRSRKLGDVDGNGQVDEDDDERAIYLTEEDRQADVQSGTPAYSRLSRAVTVRLDEIAFMGLAPQGSGYESFQQFGRDSTGRLESDYPVVAEAALITYGHGLRPYPDEEFNPSVEPTGTQQEGVVVRQLVPDGDFGQRAGDENTFILTGQPSEGGTPLDNDYEFVSDRARNEFAGDFFVLRQAALLYGGEALGIRDGDNNVLPGPVLDSRQVIPLVRDWEIAPRMNFAPSGNLRPYENAGGRRVRLDDPLALPTAAVQGGQRVPQPRLRRMGRSDIIAMTRADVQRWLEGLEGPPLDPNLFALGDERLAARRVPRPDASAWASGPFELVNPNSATEALNDPVITEAEGRIFGQPDDPLWLRQGWITNRQDLNNNGLVDDFEVRPYGDTRAGTAPSTLRAVDRRTPAYDPDDPDGGDLRGRRVQIANTRGVVSAIAGVMTRMLAETEPPRLHRRERELGAAGNPTLVSESSGLMDLHAVLVTRCSSLEIAWTNGWVWEGSDDNDLPAEWEVDSNDDGRINRVLRTGELIWFDYEMSQLEFIAAAYREFSTQVFRNEFITRYPMPDLIAEVPRGARAFNFINDPDPNYGRDVTTFFADHDYDMETPNGRLARQVGVFTPDQGPQQFRRNLMLRDVVSVNDRIESGVYDWKLSLGAENADHEYLKVFPFRRPLRDAQGRYGEPWAKPTLVRFRFTLHDEQFRVEGGRTYEFVMGVD